MNQNFATKLKDTICSSCECEDWRFLHHVWHSGNNQRLCTSCVLLSYKEAFCPTCFTVHDFTSGGKLISCNRCHSYSHAICFSSNASPSGAPSSCSSCINPNRLIFAPKKLKAKGGNGNYEAMDKNATHLLLTAAKIVSMLSSKLDEASENTAEMQVTETVVKQKEAKRAVNRVMGSKDRKNKCCNVVDKGNKIDLGSLVDSSIHSEEDSSPETLSESGRLQRLTVKGAVSEAQSTRVALDIDLNEEYPS